MFWNTILKSIRRRKKEIRFVSLITFVSVILMSSLSLFQTVMDQYLREMNYKNYGEWVLSSIDEELDHPYFSRVGHCYTGTSFLTENGTAIGEYLGNVDQEFMKLSNLSCFEGRLPEANNEIAMTLTALSRSNHSFDLGQSITIAVTQGEELITKEFILVGTIYDYANGWKHNGEYPLPTCLVTEETLRDIGEISYTTHFYQLDRIYEDIQMSEFIMPFMERASEKYSQVLAELESIMEKEEWMSLLEESDIEKAEKYVIQYNSYVYDDSLWNSKDMFQAMQYLLITIMILVVSYLLMSYVSKRAKWYYQFRATGATRLQIWAMIAIEAGYGIVPWAVIAFIIPYGVGFFICRKMAEVQGIPEFYVIDKQNSLLQVASIVALYVIATICACIRCSNKHLSRNTKELTSKQIKCLRNHKTEENLVNGFWKRQNKLYPYQRVINIIFMCVMSGIIALCVLVISSKIGEYKLLWGGYQAFDFQAYSSDGVEIFYHVKLDGTEEVEERIDYTGYKTIHKGISEEIEAQMKLIDGIRNYDKAMQESTYDLDWEGRQDSEIIQQPMIYADNKVMPGEQYIDGKEAVVNSFIYSEFYFLENYQNAIEKFGKLADVKGVKEDKFEAGEQIVVILNEQMQMNWNTMEEYFIVENTLENGEIVSIVNENAAKVCEAEALVVHASTQDWMTTLGYEYTEPYIVIGSYGLAEKLSQIQNRPCEYTDIFVEFEATASYESTAKRLAALFTEHGYSYGSLWERKQQDRDIIIRDSSIYGTLLIIVLVTFYILKTQMNEMKQYDRMQKYQIFKRLGMSDDQFKRSLLLEGVKDLVWIFVGIPIGYILFYSYAYKAYEQELGTSELIKYSTILKANTSKRSFHAMQDIVDYTNPLVIIGAMLLMFLIAFAIVCHSANKSMGKEGKRL